MAVLIFSLYTNHDDLPIYLNNMKYILLLTKRKTLGVHVDSNLTFEHHVEEV